MRLDKDKICIQIDNEHSIVEDKKTFLYDLDKLRDLLSDMKIAILSPNDKELVDNVRFFNRELYLLDNYMMKLTSVISLLELKESNEDYELKF